MDIGDVLDDRYRLTDRLGEGGTSTVFRAKDLELGRTVAIKVFGADSELSDPIRHRREARLLAGLRHPAIVALFDARLDAEPPYLVLEYVPGETLAELLARGPLPRAAARRIAASSAEGLARAHAEGVVHRDVKPANILVPDEGDTAARLLDFGIAYAAVAARHTTAGSVLGSVTYLSPEQARGEELHGSSDVYSLGLVFIEALTGRPAFAGTTGESLAARLVGPPSLDDPALAAEASLLARMTALEPADRPDAAEVVRELGEPESLEELAATRVLPAPPAALAPTVALTAASTVPPPPAQPVAGPPSRRRVLLRAGVGIATALVLLVGGAAALEGFLADPTPAPTGKTPLPTPVPVESDVDPDSEEDEPGNNGNNDNGNNGNPGNDNPGEGNPGNGNPGGDDD